ncbi:MAG: condensation domain-containing protein, partial [Pirellulales bacterium]|nr:condensation domain-containing protein [Pirellulales bacterium]
MTAASELRTTAPLGLPDMRAIVQDEYPLTDLQQGILLASLTSQGRDPYVQVICGYVNEFGDVDAFERAWQYVIDNTDVMRTSFHWDDTANPVQRVHENVVAKVDRHDWGNRGREQQRRDLQAFVDQQAKTRFRLDEPLPFHLNIVRLSDDACALVLTVHHIILDGRSIASLMTSAVTAYRSLRRGETPTLVLPPPFRNYVHWVTTQDFSASEEF